MTSEQQWQAVVARDARAAFVYGVRSTGIYCRPGCPSRRPLRRHVAFFETIGAAEKAGYRACRRCSPGAAATNAQAEAVRRVCAVIDSHDAVPTLAELSVVAERSPYHLQRLFKRMMGVTPREYAARRRVGRFTTGVRNGHDVTGALYEAGFGSSSRLYESATAKIGMTPGAYKRGGAGERITYTISASPFGRLLVARTGRGVCAVNLGDSDAALERWIRREFHAADLRPDAAALGPAVRAILDLLRGVEPRIDLPLDVQATAFQQRVWRELQKIPCGATRSYGDIARAIGQPTAARAVARACATNPVPLIVPCHRVVPGTGGIGGYRLGSQRKERLLAAERQARAEVRRK